MKKDLNVDLINSTDNIAQGQKINFVLFYEPK